MTDSILTTARSDAAAIKQARSYTTQILRLYRLPFFLAATTLNDDPPSSLC